MCNLIEDRDKYCKTFRSLWHYYRDEPFLNDDSTVDDFPADNNNSASFKFKIKIVGKIEQNNDIKKC